MASAGDAGTTLRFSIPYWTRWGQNVVVIVDYGNEGPRRHALVCRHQDDDLLWEGELQIKSAAENLEYSYAITDEAAEIEAEEMSKRSLAIPKGLTGGSIIELRDSWQVEAPLSPPDFLLVSPLLGYAPIHVLTPGTPYAQPILNTASVQDSSHPAYLLASNAFMGNILGPRRPAPSSAIARQPAHESEVVVRFILW